MAKEIPRASQKRLLRLISARADIQYSQAAYHAFRGSEEPSLRYSTFLAMVISYMRPFTENHGLGRLQCEFPDYPDFDLPEAGVRHQRMIDLRNKFLGHSSLEGTRVVLLAPGAKDPGTGRIVSEYSCNVAKNEFLRVEFVIWLHELIDCLENKLNESIDQVLSEIGPAYLEPSEVRYPEPLADDFKWTPA